MARPWYPELLDDVANNRDVESRLNALERTRRLGRASLDAGTLHVSPGGQITFDADGQTIQYKPQVPSTPTGLNITTGTDQNGIWIDVAWNPVEGALNYRVELEEAFVGRLASVSTELNQVRFVSGLKQNNNYNIRVTAVNGVGFSSYVEGSTTTATDSSLPGAVTGLTLAGGILLLVAKWNARTENDVLFGGKYELEVATNNTFTTGQQSFVTAALVHAVNNLTAGTWWVRVRAIDASGNAGAWSTASSVTVLANPAGRDFTANPILNTEISDNAVTTGKIAANTIEAGDIAAATITGTQIAGDTITGGHIAAGSIAAADAVFAAAAIQSADINTLTVQKLTTGNFTAATMTLLSSGVLRAGSTSAPFNYLIISGTGIEFWAGGSAAYTGGTRRLLMDVATGNVSIMGSVTIGGPGNAGTSFTVLGTTGEATMVADEYEVGANRIRTDELYVGAARIGQMNSDITIYVDPTSGNNENTGASMATGVKHINEALRRLPKIINFTATIIVKTSTTAFEEVRIEGFTGGGTLRLEAESGTTLSTVYGSLFIGGCTIREIQIVNRFLFHDSGATSTEKTVGTFAPVDSLSTYPGTVTIAGATFVRFIGAGANHLGIDSRSIRRFSLFAGNGSQVEGRSVWTVNALDACVAAYRHSRIQMWNMSGGAAPGTLSFWSTWNGKIVAAGTGPDYSGSDAYVNFAGELYKEPGYTSTNRAVPASPVVNQYTVRWPSTGSNSYQYYPGAPQWRNDGTVRQGNYGYGNHKGYWFFNDANIRTVLATSTINSVRFFMRRRSEGGVSGAQIMDVCVHNQSTNSSDAMGAFVGAHSFRWGEGRWLSLPNSVGNNFRDNTAKGIGLYTADGSDYAICDGAAELEITFTK
jgi:hypothetical protein